MRVTLLTKSAGSFNLFLIKKSSINNPNLLLSNDLKFTAQQKKIKHNDVRIFTCIVVTLKNYPVFLNI